MRRVVTFPALFCGWLAALIATGASNLPVLDIRSTEPIRSGETVPCVVLLAEPEPNAVTDLKGKVRFHGASSQMYPKKSFALTLDSPASWLGLREGRGWVINAAFVDRSLMRHKLSYDLFRALSTPDAKRFSSASRFVEVALKGRYHGVYLLMERVDAGLLQLQRFDGDAKSHACIYKAEDHAANFTTPGHWGYEQREPSPEVMEYWKPLDSLNAFVSRAPDDEFFDPEKGIAARMDMDNAIDFHLLVLMTCNKDGIDKNFIIARDASRADKPRPRFFFVPWDYDATFGRSWDASRLSPERWLSNHLFDRLLGNDTYRRKYMARWRELRQGTFAVTNIARMMDENVAALGVAAKRNEQRWDTYNGPYPDQLTFEEDVKEMKAWLVVRHRWMDRQLARLTGLSVAESQTGTGAPGGSDAASHSAKDQR